MTMGTGRSCSLLWVCFMKEKIFPKSPQKDIPLTSFWPQVCHRPWPKLVPGKRNGATMTSLDQLGIALKYMPVPRKVDPLGEGKQASIRKEKEQRGKKVR